MMNVEVFKKKLVIVKPPSFSSCYQQTDSLPLDDHLWTRLPSELLDQVLARLPVVSFVRLRLVCKAWNSLASSTQFLRISAQMMPSVSCVMFFAEDKFMWERKVQHVDIPCSIGSCGRKSRSYCHLIKRRRSNELPSISFSSIYSNIRCGLSLDFLPNPYRIKVLSTAKGLVLCTSGIHLPLVCNPLTKNWRALPPILTRSHPLLSAIVADAKITGAYKVIFAAFKGSEIENLEAYVYESKRRYWRKLSCLTKRIERYPRFYIGRATHCDGVLYWVAPEFDGTLITFQVDQEIWSTLKTVWAEGLRWPQLIEEKGKLMMIGVVQKSLSVWKLEEKSAKWLEIGRVPRDVSKAFVKCLCGLECAKMEDYVYVSAYNKPGILVYNLFNNKCEWFPSLNDAQPSLFEPRLDACV